MPLVRLDKILTDTGLCSRSQAREIIRRGRAAVNGTPCADPTAKFDPEAVSLTVDGEPIDGPGHIYIMLNKPAGVLTATRDPRKPTVVDAMPEDWKRRGLFPVGRLDKDKLHGDIRSLYDPGAAHGRRGRLLRPKRPVP